MFNNSDDVLELLLDNGMVTQDQVGDAWGAVDKSEGQMDVIDALIAQHVVTQDDVMAMLAQQYGMDFVDLTNYDIPEEVIKMVPESAIEKYRIHPISRASTGRITVAMVDPTDISTLDALRYVLGCDVDAVIAPQSQIDALIKKNYSSIQAHADELLNKMGGADVDVEHTYDKDDKGDADEHDDAPIIRLVTNILTRAYETRASDIHLEPMEKRYRVRYRIDGALQEVDGPPKYLQANITSRLKIMAKLDISEKRIPQDGRINLKMVQLNKEIDLRVSTIPTNYGESIVMRILDKSSIQLDIPKLGFYADDQEIVERVLGLPDGVFLVTGPTGSGKTTSLYAFLNTINTPNRKIITAEDPIEYQLAGINQCQIEARIGFTFQSALRAMLRQAPNVIMVGEIRDYETAAIAINAALTGHMVFSTLHTNDAPGAVSRLIDMGIKPFLVASAVRAIMAQRLLRRVCKFCAEPYTPEPHEIEMLQLTPEFLATAQFKKGKGCDKCSGGYKGRMGIYEIFEVNDELRKLIFKKEPTAVIKDEARKLGMRTLREDGLRKAADGTTTLNEVIIMTVGDEEIEE